MNSYTRLALSLLLVAACGDMPGTGTTSMPDPSTTSTDASTSTTGGSSSGGGDSSTTDADASTSAGSSSTSDASSGEGSGGGDGSTGEPAPVPTACFGTPCTDSAECLPGLRCMTHPETGEGMCVTTCLAAPICDVEAVSCGAFIPKVAPVECIDGGCFPAVCDVLADCPAGSVECDAGLCY